MHKKEITLSRRTASGDQLLFHAKVSLCQGNSDSAISKLDEFIPQHIILSGVAEFPLVEQKFESLDKSKCPLFGLEPRGPPESKAYSEFRKKLQEQNQCEISKSQKNVTLVFVPPGEFSNSLIPSKDQQGKIRIFVHIANISISSSNQLQLQTQIQTQTSQIPIQVHKIPTQPRLQTQIQTQTQISTQTLTQTSKPPIQSPIQVPSSNGINGFNQTKPIKSILKKPKQKIEEINLESNSNDRIVISDEIPENRKISGIAEPELELAENDSRKSYIQEIEKRLEKTSHVVFSNIDSNESEENFKMRLQKYGKLVGYHFFKANNFAVAYATFDTTADADYVQSFVSGTLIGRYTVKAIYRDREYQDGDEREFIQEKKRNNIQSDWSNKNDSRNAKRSRYRHSDYQHLNYQRYNFQHNENQHQKSDTTNSNYQWNNSHYNNQLSNSNFRSGHFPPSYNTQHSVTNFNLNNQKSSQRNMKSGTQSHEVIPGTGVLPAFVSNPLR